MFEVVDIQDHIPLAASTFVDHRLDLPLSQQQQLQQQEGGVTTHEQQQQQPLEDAAHHQQQQSHDRAEKQDGCIYDPEATFQGRRRLNQALISGIATKYLFRVVPDLGLAVSVAGITEVDEDVPILSGEPRVWVRCTFTLVIFCPKPGARLRARIVEQCPVRGMRLSVEFFDQIWVPVQLLPDGSEYSKNKKQWGRRDETGHLSHYVKPENLNATASKDIKNSVDNAGVHEGSVAANSPDSCICCVEKVTVVTQTETNDSSSAVGADSSSSLSLMNSKGESAMKIVASFRTCEGLGPEWWFLGDVGEDESEPAAAAVAKE